MKCKCGNVIDKVSDFSQYNALCYFFGLKITDSLCSSCKEKIIEYIIDYIEIDNRIQEIIK